MYSSDSVKSFLLHCMSGSMGGGVHHFLIELESVSANHSEPSHHVLCFCSLPAARPTIPYLLPKRKMMIYISRKTSVPQVDLGPGNAHRR